jgi:hypothetical protein
LDQANKKKAINPILMPIHKKKEMGVVGGFQEGGGGGVGLEFRRMKRGVGEEGG